MTPLNFDVRFTPRKQTFAQAIGMSALGHEGDIRRDPPNLPFCKPQF